MKKGISASKGYAIGYAAIKCKSEIRIFEKTINDVEAETNRLKKSIETTRRQLLTIKERAERELGSDKAQVFESHLMLLEDPEFVGVVETNIVCNRINVEKALKDVMDMYVTIFEAMDDEYIKERASDVKDVGRRILTNLGEECCNTLEDLSKNSIVIANDLTPSDIAQLDKSKAIAFLTDSGGITSHTAIMARTLEIPAVVGLGDITTTVKEGDRLIVDGVEGIVIINPDENKINEYKAKKEEFETQKESLKSLRHINVLNKEGNHVEVCANIGKPEDAIKALENGGESIGLFRTEFLYMDREDFPTEDEQYEAYKFVAVKMQGKSVIIRTIDIGGDKQLAYMKLPVELNPALGYRAIRVCLLQKEIFKVQIRAILRAAVFGNLKIMFPMISTIGEFKEAKCIVKECMQDLKKEGKPFEDNIEVGMMIEVPAAALMAEEFAKYADFFSIGTNDLTQYTVAADRANEKVSYLYNATNPAVLKLIKMTIEAAHKEGKVCSLCGEAAEDEHMIPILLEYGLDKFSVNTASILKVKHEILNYN